MASKKPIIYLIDDDAQVLASIRRDIRARYRSDYRILQTTSPDEALSSLEELERRGEVVALFISDQRMPGMSGTELLAQSRAYFPGAKRALLTAYSDTDAAIAAINEVGLDYYLTKPWDPPEERLYPIVDDLLDAWRASYHPEFAGVRIVGPQWSPLSHELKDFLAGNMVPFRFFDADTSPVASELMGKHGIDPGCLPTVLVPGAEAPLRRPSTRVLAEAVGLRTTSDRDVHDVVVVGGGPAGLAAGVYGASEGLRTVVVERRAPGGQAGTSSRIENYLGFPSGLSGADLARRAVAQAARLGAELLSPQAVERVEVQEDGFKRLVLTDGAELVSRSIVVATGVDYRRLPVDSLEKFGGAGVYYGAATTEAPACRCMHVYIVGGGNSAGQGAMYLSKYADHVHIVIRGESLAKSMSAYLIEQIDGRENITVHSHTEIREGHGETRLEGLTIADNRTNETRRVEAGALFVFIGTRPSAEWLPAEVLRNERGFVETGRELLRRDDFKALWPHRRDPYLLETSIPGVFAAGDIRAGGMARVASAVGEGSMAIKFVHQYLAGD